MDILGGTAAEKVSFLRIANHHIGASAIVPGVGGLSSLGPFGFSSCPGSGGQQHSRRFLPVFQQSFPYSPSVAASGLGDHNLAYKLFLSAMRSYAKPPFTSMTETPSNSRAVFLTAEGVFLQRILFGFTGLRFANSGLAQKYKPLLPPSWQSLELRCIRIQGKPYNVEITNEKGLTLTPVAE